MMNFRIVPTDRDDEDRGTSNWRSFGSIASHLAARAEARLVARATEDADFVPVAWAAE